jgi:hypothetical protein
MKKTILLACVILAILAGTALAQKGYTWQERARIDYLEGGAKILDCVNLSADSLSQGEVVEFDTTWTPVCDTTGVANATKYFGMSDTGAFGGASSVGNYNPTNRPTFRLYILIRGTTTVPDTFFIMGKDSSGTFQKDSCIIADGANKSNSTAKAFWEIDSIHVLGAMDAGGDSLRIKMLVKNRVVTCTGTENNRGIGVVVGRYTSASTPAFTRAGIRQVVRVAVSGTAVRAKCSGNTALIRCGTPLTGEGAGTFEPDATLATGLSAGIALEGCNRATTQIWVLLDRN